MSPSTREGGLAAPSRVGVGPRRRLPRMFRSLTLQGFIFTAPLLLVFYRVSQPFIFVLERSSAAVSRMLGLRSGEAGSGHSVEELRLIASSVRAAGRMSSFEENALAHLLDLSNLSVREVMVPRNSIASIPVEASLDHLLRMLATCRSATGPVFPSLLAGHPGH